MTDREELRAIALVALVSTALAVICVLLASGCFRVQTMDKLMASWTGQPADKLIQSWGAPDKESTLSDGRRVLTWVHPWTSGSPNMVTHTTDITSGTCRQSFTVSHEGLIEQWSYSDCSRYWVERK